MTRKRPMITMAAVIAVFPNLHDLTWTTQPLPSQRCAELVLE